MLGIYYPAGISKHARCKHTSLCAKVCWFQWNLYLQKSSPRSWFKLTKGQHSRLGTMSLSNTIGLFMAHMASSGEWNFIVSSCFAPPVAIYCIRIHLLLDRAMYEVISGQGQLNKKSLSLEVIYKSKSNARVTSMGRLRSLLFGWDMHYKFT